MKPITLTVTRRNPLLIDSWITVAESTNFNGYLPRKGEMVKISGTDYEVQEVLFIYEDGITRVREVELVVVEL